MAEIKYKRETKKKKIKGMKDPVTVYKKAGSSKLYVRCNGRMRSYVSYKKSCLKKISAKKAKPVRRKTRVRGGSACNMGQHEQQGGENIIYSENLAQGGTNLKSQSKSKSKSKSKSQSQSQKGGIFGNLFNSLDELQLPQGGGAKGRRRGRGRARGRGGGIKGGTTNDFDIDTLKQMEQMEQMEQMDQVEEYENEDKEGLLGGGRRRSRRAASPKRRRAASPKRRRAASPKRRRAASPKRRRSTRR